MVVVCGSVCGGGDRGVGGGWEGGGGGGGGGCVKRISWCFCSCMNVFTPSSTHFAVIGFFLTSDVENFNLQTNSLDELSV